MSKKYIVALDQGTSSSRTLIFDVDGKVVASSQKPLKNYFPKNGWVEQDAMEIWATQLATMKDVFQKIPVGEVASIGITNQRETTIIWNKKTGKPIAPAIVWQDRRTAEDCTQLASDAKLLENIKSKTGLVLDAYFSASKIKWILDNYEVASSDELLFGTVDSWLLWNLTNGSSHCTDVTNASRTLLFDIQKLQWSQELLEIFKIPSSILPEIKDSADNFGTVDAKWFGQEIDIHAMIGDQQSALYGQRCIEEGSIKNTYGTGCFIMLNTGKEPTFSDKGLLTTLAWKRGKEVKYALEGSIFMTGATIQWLKEGLQLIDNLEDCDFLAQSITDNGGVYLVPAFVGLGVPHWNPNARAILCGMERGTSKAHICRAALESTAYQTKDIIDLMMKESHLKIQNLRVDGGGTASEFLMQFQSDILKMNIQIPTSKESTAFGAALMAGEFIGFYNQNNKENYLKRSKEYSPNASELMIENWIQGWANAVKKCLA